MNAINSTTALPELQSCDVKTFFDIVDLVDLTALKNEIIGPETRGAKLKELDLSIRLYLWNLQCMARGKSTTVEGLCRELNDPQSQLANLCRFSESKEPPVSKTISNHFRRINEHPDLVRDVLSRINEVVAGTSLRNPSSAAEKAEEGADRRKGCEPKNRDKENVDHRRRRRQEAVGDREFKPIVATAASGEEYMLQAIHGVCPECHICREKSAQGWTCTKDHVHGVVVEIALAANGSRQWKCHCCEYKLSITSGTVFHGTNFSCQEILIVLRYMLHFRRGISSQDLAGLLNEEGRDVSEGAARMLMHRLRECMREETFERFAGETEIDEMLLRLNDGRRVSIITAYNRPTRRVRFKIIEREGAKKPQANKREMLKFIRETTEPRSIILTDSTASVPKSEEMGRLHGCVNHKKRQFKIYSNLDGALDKPIEVGSNGAEGKHAFLRRTLGIRNGISRHHLERYLLEAMWRINYLHNELESQKYVGEERRNLSLMMDLLAGAAGRKITRQDLLGEPQKKRDRSSRRTRTAPVSSPEKTEQPALLPHGPIVPGASQSESRQVKQKRHQTHPPQKLEHPVLLPSGPIVPGPSQFESRQVKQKRRQTRPPRKPQQQPPLPQEVLSA